MNEKEIANNQRGGLLQPSNKMGNLQPERNIPNINKGNGRGRGSCSNDKTIRYFSMFTGIGGFELGLERASSHDTCTEQQGTQGRGWNNDKAEISDGIKGLFSCIGCSEIDKYCNQVLRHRFPDIKNYGDATKINPAELPDFELLCGGFPCQSFSIAGRRQGFADERGTMFGEIVRIIEAKKPKYLFLENVRGLLSAPLINEQSEKLAWTKGYCFAFILQRLAEHGYDVQWLLCNSKFFGVPQNRERVFIIGNLGGCPRPKILPFGTSQKENRDTNKIVSENRDTNKIVSENRDTNKIVSVSIKNKNRAKHQAKGLPYGTFPKVYNLEINKDMGVSYACKSATHEFMVGKINKFQYGKHQQDAIIDINGICPTIPQGTHDSTPHLLKIYEKKEIKADYRHPFKGSKGYEDSPAIKSSEGSGNQILINGLRRLTPLECERLQGFPDGWTKYGINEKGEKVEMSDAQRYKMCGNAVTVNVIQAIGEQILKSI
jgi:DNA (cytosine-5)-methyltransferase 1